MTNRIIAVLLAISLASCSSVPRFAPGQPASSADAVVSPSTADDGASSDQKPKQKTAEGAAEHPDTTPGKRSPLAEFGKGIVLIGLFAFFAWLNYRFVLP